jgi:plasmid replication initiation protein
MARKKQLKAEVKYTQEEMDILSHVMSIIRSDRTEYQFSVSDIEQVGGKKINKTQFRTSILNLAQRPYEKFYSEDKWETFFIFKSIEYDNNATIKISLNEEVLLLLCDLKANYTKIQLSSLPLFDMQEE